MATASSNVQVKFTLKGEDRASAVINKAGRSADSASSRFLSLSKSAIAAAGGFAAIGAASRAVADSMISFSAELGKLATLLPDQPQRVRELGDAIRQMSKDFGVSRAELSEGAFQVVSAFGDSAQTVERLRIVTKASKAGAADAASSLALLSSVTKGYGDTSASAMRHVSDLAFQTNKLGQTTFPELAASMGKVVPLAAQLGVTQEELFAVFATLTGVTGNASDVSTQLSSVLTALIKDSTGASKAIKKLGDGSARTAIEQLGLVGALRKLTEEGGTSAEAMQALFKRKEAVLGVTPLLTTQADLFNKKLAIMRSESNATDEALNAVTQQSGQLASEWAKLTTSVEDLFLAFGQGNDKELAGFLRSVRAAVDGIARFSKVIVAFIKVLGKPFVDAISLAQEALFALGFAAAKVAKGEFKRAKETFETFIRSAKTKAKDGAQAWRDLGSAIDEVMSPKKRRIDMSAGGFKSVDEFIAKGKAAQRRKGRGGRRKARTGKADPAMRAFLKDDPLFDAQMFAGLANDMDAADAKERADAIIKAMAGPMEQQKEAALAADKLADRLHAKDQKRSKDKIDTHMRVASSITGSVASIMATFGAQEAAMRVQAGVEAAIAFGKGWVAFGEGKLPQAAAFFAGSAALAAQALAPPSLSAPSGGPAATAIGPSAVGAGPGGGGGRVVNVNFGNGVVLGNPHEVARTIKGALAVSAGTGF